MPQTMIKGGGASRPDDARIGSLSSTASNPGHSSRSDCRRPSAMLQQPSKPGKVTATAPRTTPANMTGARSCALSHSRALGNRG